jgi:hypothetical protein
MLNQNRPNLNYRQSLPVRSEVRAPRYVAGPSPDFSSLQNPLRLRSFAVSLIERGVLSVLSVLVRIVIEPA